MGRRPQAGLHIFFPFFVARDVSMVKSDFNRRRPLQVVSWWLENFPTSPRRKMGENFKKASRWKSAQWPDHSRGRVTREMADADVHIATRAPCFALSRIRQSYGWIFASREGGRITREPTLKYSKCFECLISPVSLEPSSSVGRFSKLSEISDRS